MAEPSAQSHQVESAARPLAAVILAAGQSKRMRSDLVKVLHDVCGKPMLQWVIDACRGVGANPICIVIGHHGEQVREAFAGADDLKFVEQAERLGTGHAVQQAEPVLREFEGDVIVLGGDGPLIRAQTLHALVEAHRATDASASLATAEVGDPTGYGRIVRDDSGEFIGIVEEKDATSAQQQIREINPTYYCVSAADLFAALRHVGNDNAQGEFYLTDIFAILRAAGKHVTVVQAAGEDEVLSINTPEQLDAVSAIMNRRLMQEARA